MVRPRHGPMVSEWYKIHKKKAGPLQPLPKCVIKRNKIHFEQIIPVGKSHHEYKALCAPTLYIRVSKGYTPEGKTEKNITSLPKKETSC